MNPLSLLGVVFMALSIYGAAVPPSPEAWAQMQSGMNTFAGNLLKVSTKERSVNVLYSPPSIHIGLGMTSFGAGGITKSEIQEALHLPSDQDMTKNSYKKTMETFNSIAGLHAANKIYAAETFEINKQFQEILETYFQSSCETVNFTDAIKSADTINKWVAEQTNGHITKFTEPGQFTDETAAILINAISYKSKWAIPFNSSQTTFEPFYIDETTTKDVETMHGKAIYNYGELSSLQAKYIELKYQDNTKMIVIVPENSNNVNYILENYSKINFNDLPGQPTHIKISLPKFKYTYNSDLNSYLEELNIKSMFKDDANFENMAIGGRPVKVTKVQQKSFIEVNEEGSSSAAVTGIQIETMSVPIYTDFNINKPFFFLILPPGLETPIFVGYVVDPSQSS